MSSPALKRRKTSPSDNSDTSSSISFEEGDAHSDLSSAIASDHDSLGTEDEIAAAQRSQKTGKRKRRATEPSKFGITLQSLLSTDAPSALPLSLKPSINRKRNDEQLDFKAKRALQVERKEKEENGRIVDVIGGWGGENERALRKVAQRGVVKLFNLIQQSQTSAREAATKSKAERGTGKATLPAPAAEPQRRKSKGKGRDRDNLVGRRREVGKDDFFEMIRSGSAVSKG